MQCSSPMLIDRIGCVCEGHVALNRNQEKWSWHIISKSYPIFSNFKYNNNKKKYTKPDYLINWKWPELG